MTASSHSTTKFMVTGAILMALILGISVAFADPPPTVNVRGQLLDPQGHALSGLREFRVQFYDAASGGTALGLAISGQTEVSLEGLFNITVTLPAPVLTAAEVWYEIALSSSATPGPLVSGDTFPNRVKVESVPFAIESAKANQVDVAGVGTGSVTASEFDALSGVSANIQGQLDAKVNSADVYSKSEVDASQSAQDSAIGAKANSTDVVAKAGDTMTGALVMSSAPVNVMNSYLSLGQTAVPYPTPDRLYNHGGVLEWDGRPAYRFPWAIVATPTVMSANNGYIVQSTSLLTLTLPSSVSVTFGDIVRVNGMGSGGWKVAQNASQKILTGPLQIPDYSGAWTPRDSLRTWLDVASSADGAKLLALDSNGYLYTSADWGATWTARDSVRSWDCVASSANGTRLVACVDSDAYTSTDSGVTWTRRYNVFPSTYPLRVASSADGTRLVACTANGPLYTSTDSGTTWTARDSSRVWNWVDSSADGTKLVACVGRYTTGQIYTSTDSGATWTPHGPTLQWYSVASSGDGTKLVACVLNGQIYTSTDSGVTWTPRGMSQAWRSVASSADGMRLVACSGANGGAIYTSIDSGATWVPNASTTPHPGLWEDVASSADGTKLVACGAWGTGGQIYTYSYWGATITSTTVGTDGFIMGGFNTAVELQYVGNDTFCPLSHEGSLSVN